jgi:hypothetical protein
VCCSSGVGFRGGPDSSWLILIPFRTYESLGALLNLKKKNCFPCAYSFGV